ncbi:hypothetical protein PCL_07048 [Purpureocillium lilacinum]|uniref:Uncharacterized protein n=1 Tax=Purpureocillium lilacinum TaxID=33203 RepID=A0A2U3DT65_PURLI|nr:hypothetical protein PCL_07048 [Purpureocillium lilacinum]
MYIGDVRHALETVRRYHIPTFSSLTLVEFPSPGATDFDRVRRDTLEFVKTILPEWPIISVDQVYRIFHAYHNRPVPEKAAESHIFWLILSLGDLICHLRQARTYEMEEKFGAPMTDLFLLRRPANIVTLQIRVLEILRCRYAGYVKICDVDSLVQEASGDIDLFSSVAKWTYVNLLWDSPTAVSSTIDPETLPWPSEHYFTGMFGEAAWHRFVAKCVNTIALYKLQCGSPMMDLMFGGDSGQALGWIRHTAPSLISVYTAMGDGLLVQGDVYQLAESCATNCELCLLTIQKLDHVNRLFMLQQ